MTDEGPFSAPPRLVNLPGMDQLFADVESEFRRDLDESIAWQRLHEELERKRLRAARLSRMRWLLPLAAAIIPFALLLSNRTNILRDNARADLSVTKPAEPVDVDLVKNQPKDVPSKPDQAHVKMRLAAGQNVLPDASVVTLHAQSQAEFVDNPERSVVTLNSGEAEVRVTRKTQGRHFSVLGGAYEFRVIGTSFSVKHAPPRTELRVTEGRVAVLDGERPIASVGAGEQWSSEDPSQIIRAAKSSSAAVKATKPTEVKSIELTNCRDKLHAGDPQAAERCYRELATGQGLAAEMALYEVARVQRDVLSNPRAALATLEEHQQRFSAGVLSPEIQLARIEILARLGRSNDALQASEQALQTSVGRARESELRLMRGRILRDKLGDCARAEKEYAIVAHEPGARGDTAEFARASCLERLGRKEEAAAVYRSYLARPKPSQSAAAQKRLSELEP